MRNNSAFFDTGVGIDNPQRPNTETPSERIHIVSPEKHSLKSYQSILRYQYASGLLLSTLCPLIWIVFSQGFTTVALHTVLTIFTAFSFGFLIFRKITFYPSARDISLVYLSFTLSFIATLLSSFILMPKLDLVITSVAFAVTALWIMATHLLEGRKQSDTFLLIGENSIDPKSGLASAIETNHRFISRPMEKPGVVFENLRTKLSDQSQQLLMETALEGRPVLTARQFEENLSGRVCVENLSEIPFQPQSSTLLYLSAKRFIDIILSIIALIILAPALLLVSLAIRLESSGPVIYKQKRIGYGRKEFIIWKFRSMRELTEAELQDTANLQNHNEARITRIGRFIRRTRFDELPQIFNILKGEMSWIGPRPESQVLSNFYEQKLPFYRYRFTVKPGITGWAQIRQGHVTGIENAQLKLEYDFYYEKHFSFWLDLRILLSTVRVVLTGHGAK